MILMERIHAERIARVRTALESCGLTQMIVCDPKSVWYLTGVAVEPYERLLALYLPVAGEPTLLSKLPSWWMLASRWASIRNGPPGS